MIDGTDVGHFVPHDVRGTIILFYKQLCVLPFHLTNIVAVIVSIAGPMVGK